MTDPTPLPEDGTPDATPTTAMPTTATPTTATQTSFGAHPVVVYTLKRLGLLLAVGAICYLVGLRGVWLILFAFLLSGVIAMIALKNSREGAAYGITSAVKKANHKIEASTRAEDLDLDDDLDESGAVVADEREPDDRA